MSDQPSDLPASGANDPEPEGSYANANANAIASTEETQTEMPEEFDLESTNMDQLMVDFVNSIDPVEMAAYFASFDPPRPRPPLATSNERALSSYLIQMQVLGGIPREELEPMQHTPGLGHIRAPSQLVLVNNEFRVPIISSATFNGRLAPLFITEARQVSAQSSNNGDSLDQEIGADAVSYISFDEEREFWALQALKPISDIRNTDCTF
jgi:hypothetical protein